MAALERPPVALGHGREWCDPTEVTATAEWGGSLVVATAAARGGLRDLAVDPRVWRQLDHAGLAEVVLEVATAATRAAESYYVDPADQPVDPILAPVLAELDRLAELITDPTPNADVPVLGADLGLGELRRTLCAVHSASGAVRATAESADGFVTATVDARGALVDLRLDRRLPRDAHTVAAAVQHTARTAQARVAVRQAELATQEWA